MKNRLISLRKQVLVWLTHKAALPMLVLIRSPAPFQYRFDDLPAMAEGSTGRALLSFLREHRLDMLTHYERHDIKHVLLGYAPVEEGEVCLQAFMLGNGHISFPVIATILFGLATMPFSWRAMQQAYRRGKKAESLENLDWADLLPKNLAAVRTALRIEE